MRKIKIRDLVVLVIFVIAIVMATREPAPQIAFEWSVERDYLTVAVPSDYPTRVKLTGWQASSRGKSATIGRGAPIFYSGQLNPLADIWLAPGERATITFSRSPLGLSFRTNACGGYLAEWQEFRPPLPRDCPRQIPTECREKLTAFPTCVTARQTPPELTPFCLNYLLEKLNYNGCVSENISKPKFLGEWRIYLELEAGSDLTLSDEIGKRLALPPH